MKRVLICGDRHWGQRFDAEGKPDEELNHLERWLLLSQISKEAGDISLVIHGDAKGADRAGGFYAETLGLVVQKFPYIGRLGAAGGPVRNRQMLVEGKPDEVWAFHPDLSESKGTKNMVKQARKAGVTVRLFNRDGEIQ